MCFNDISGSFRPLTPAQIKGNARFVALWSIPFLIVIVGVVVAVKTGIVWVAAASGAVSISTLFLVKNICNAKYEYKFGFKYNLLRSFILGVLVFSGVVWRSLLGFYYRLCMIDGWDMPLSTFGWLVLSLSLAITLISKLTLYFIITVSVADIVGVIETAALAFFIGSIMFILLYT